MNPPDATLAFPASLAQSLRLMQEQFGNSSDFVVRPFQLGGDPEAAGRSPDGKMPALASGEGAALYIDGLVDGAAVRGNMETLLRCAREYRLTTMTKQYDWADLVQYVALPADSMQAVSTTDEACEALLSGATAFLFDGYAGALLVHTPGGEERSVEEPATETSVRGPREGFTELMRTNTAMVRRKVKDKRLRTEQLQIGRVTKTNVEVMHISGIADESLVTEVLIRLKRIDVDSILESGYIEEMIEDETYALFPTVANTERPDVVAANLLEGRVAVFVDGTPFVLLAPAVFIQFFQAAEDYYHRYTYGLIRLLRLLCFFIAMFGPGFYISVTTFHQEMLPTGLLVSLAAQREGVPFPAFVEALMMEVTFEILREAGVRLPRAIGQAVSIVGALVLGDAAVQAGLVSPAMVIVVSLTAIANFVIPAFEVAISLRILRFLFMALAASFGLFGMTVGFIALLLHLSSLRSFGVPFMSPFAPFRLEDQKDTLVRFPIWSMRKRPHFFSRGNRVRRRAGKPRKPPGSS